MKAALVFFCFLLFATAGSTATIYVPDDHALIQDAIIAAAVGDTIIVRAGTYVENISFLGKDIIVRSESGPWATIIDGSSPSSPDYGSAVRFENGETRGAVIEGFTLTNGSGTLDTSQMDYDGGGVSCRNGSAATIKGNIITNNNCDGHGGGISCVEGSDALIVDNVISLNGSTTVSAGGGIYCEDSSAIIEKNTISNNYANVGGGVSYENDTALVDRNEIANNYAENVGGGVYCNSGDQGSEVSRCKISSNLAENGGGGIWATASDESLIISNVIENNSVNNSGIWGGGGICVLLSQTVLVNNLISGNTCPEGGGVTVAFNSSAVLTNNTIVQNSADEGGGLWCYEATAIVENTIFWGNTAPTDPQIYYYGPRPSLSYCDVDGGWSYGNNNIDLDPRFVDPMGGDFHLTFSSPCGNAGNPDPLHRPDDDIEGDEREAFGGVDIGADEFDFHLYYMGDVIPGNTITVRATGWPNMAVNVIKGSGLRFPPVNTRYGRLYLTPPFKPIFLGRTSADGYVEYTATIPLSWKSGDRYYFQVFFGGLTFPSSRLANIKILTVQ